MMFRPLSFRLYFTALSFFVSTLVFAQGFTVTGKVIDEDQKGIANVSIQVLNSNLVSLSDEAGNFTFKNLNGGAHVVRFSSVGYAEHNKEVWVDGAMSLSVTLEAVHRRLNDAVVTASKQETDPQNISASISILNDKEIKDHYIWNIMDATAMVPNLYMSNPGDNRNITTIRGITSSSYNPAVATYVDGVGQFNLDTYIPYLYDIERVEVLRGPQGTLYGRNAMGGVINIITKKPTNTQSGFAEINIGNHGQQRYLLGFRSPLIQDKLYLGVSGLFTKSDGFYTNDFNDSHYDRQHTASGNVFLKYLPSETWAMTLNMKQVGNRNHGAFALVLGVEDALENPFHLSQNALTKMIDNTTNTSLSINHYGKGFTFSSQTAYQANQRYYDDPIDSDFSPFDVMSLINNYGKEWNSVNAFTQEFKFSSSTNIQSPWTWTGGLYLFSQKRPEKQGMYYGEALGEDGGITSLLTNTLKSQGIAVFGQVTYALSADLQVLAGLRYDYEDQKHTGKEEAELSDKSVILIQPDTSGTAKFYAFTPSISFRYKLSEESMWYASYNRGFRAGGLSPISSGQDEPSLRMFNPEYSNNFEVGNKNVLADHRVQLNVAAFYTKIDDAQVPTFVLPDAVTFTKNTGRMTSKGLEAEVNAKVFSSLDLSANIGYVHARYTDLNMQQNNGNVQMKGNRPIFTPDWTGMLGLKYTYALGTRTAQNIQVNASAKFLGHQYFDLNNTIDQKAYGLLNASVSYEIRRYSVVVWGQNLANTTHVDYAYNFGAVHLGNPRTYGLTLRKSFGHL